MNFSFLFFLVDTNFSSFLNWFLVLFEIGFKIMTFN